MRLWYDWRAAAVVNDRGDLVDVLEHDGHLTEHAVVVRLRTLAQGGLTPEALALKDRFPEAHAAVHGSPELPDAAYPLPSDAQMALADQAAVRLSIEGVQQAASDPDRRMEHLVRGSEELRAAHLTMEARLIEWAGLFYPLFRVNDRSGFVRAVGHASTPEELAKDLDTVVPEILPTASEWGSMNEWAQDTAQAQSRLDRMENALRELTLSHLPSVSALLGPLLAARLCVEAHGRQRLARLPSGTVQVLGAEKAFFQHLKTGSSPPKHGHIFMHPWINRSPRWVRGKIARMLAGKISIAARIDAFDGTPWEDEDVAKVEDQVIALREANQQPPSRRR